MIPAGYIPFYPNSQIFSTSEFVSPKFAAVMDIVYNWL